MRSRLRAVTGCLHFRGAHISTRPRASSVPTAPVAITARPHTCIDLAGAGRGRPISIAGGGTNHSCPHKGQGAAPRARERRVLRPCIRGPARAPSSHVHPAPPEAPPALPFLVRLGSARVLLPARSEGNRRDVRYRRARQWCTEVDEWTAWRAHRNDGLCGVVLARLLDGGVRNGGR